MEKAEVKNTKKQECLLGIIQAVPDMLVGGWRTDLRVAVER